MKGSSKKNCAHVVCWVWFQKLVNGFRWTLPCWQGSILYVDHALLRAREAKTRVRISTEVSQRPVCWDRLEGSTLCSSFLLDESNRILTEYNRKGRSRNSSMACKAASRLTAVSLLCWRALASDSFPGAVAQIGQRSGVPTTLSSMQASPKRATATSVTTLPGRDATSIRILSCILNLVCVCLAQVETSCPCIMY